MNARDAKRKLLVAAGAAIATASMRRAYAIARRPEIFHGVRSMPLPQSATDDLWSAQWAMIDLNLTDKMWSIGREIDMQLIHERDK